MNARLRERGLTTRPRILAGPGCFIVECAKPITSRVWVPQVKLTDTLPEAFSVAHKWAGERK